MKRFVSAAISVGMVIAAAGPAWASSPAAFKIPFKFEAAGKKLPAGEYLVERTEDGQVRLRQDAKGIDVAIPSKETLAPPDPPHAEPRLVFDAVGNFEPSYTEYFTVYLLSEVWLPGDDGLLIHATKGAHKDEIITGSVADK
ncbi:MAG: hypothetical protein JW742_05115 [Candidatus Aminicenantes bacterium]|nr:hypothetical protein [Candidatus Aminicenantes bacterium]